MSLTPQGLASAIKVEISKIPGADFSQGNADAGILALSTAIIDYLIFDVSGSVAIDLYNLLALGLYCGAPSGSYSPDYSSNYFIIDGVSLTNSLARLDLALENVSGSVSATVVSVINWNTAIQGYIGQPVSNNSTPSYVSNHYIINNDNLTLVAGKLDTALYNVSGSISATITNNFSNETLQTVTNRGAITSNAITVSVSGSKFNTLATVGNLQVGGNLSVNVGVQPTLALYVSSSNPSLDAPSYVFINGDNYNQTSYDCYSSALNLHSSQFLMRRARGSIGVPVSVAPNDQLGTFAWRGHDGTDFRQRATISCIVDGPVSANNVPCSLRFSTGNISLSSAQLRMIITSSGSIGINTATPDYTRFRLDINGAFNAQTSGSQVNNLLVQGPITSDGPLTINNVSGSRIAVLSVPGTETVQTLNVVGNETIIGFLTINSPLSQINTAGDTSSLILNNSSASGLGPQLLFRISGSNAFSLACDTATNDNFVIRRTGVDNVITVSRTTGNVGIGNIDPGVLYRLDVNGAIRSRVSGSQFRDTQVYGVLAVSGSFTLGDTSTVQEFHPTTNVFISSNSVSLGGGNQLIATFNLTPGVWKLDFNHQWLMQNNADGNFDFRAWLEDGTFLNNTLFHMDASLIANTPRVHASTWSAIITVPSTVPYKSYTLYGASELNEHPTQLWYMGDSNSGSKIVAVRIR